MIKICNWHTAFENNRSRAIDNCTWVSVPNKHDGEGYSTVMAHKDAAEIFAAWILMVQLASRVGKVRRDGTLVRPDGTPMPLAAMAVKTRAPESWFKKAIPVLVQVGWIEQVMAQTSPERQADVTPTSPERHETDVRVPRREGEGTEKEGRGAPAADLFFGMSEQRKTTFEEWLRYKSERGQKYKPTGLKTLIAEHANKTDTELAEAARHSMANNYAGIYAPAKPASINGHSAEKHPTAENRLG